MKHKRINYLGFLSLLALISVLGWATDNRAGCTVSLGSLVSSATFG